jgi:HK97 family phage prohead protease
MKNIYIKSSIKISAKENGFKFVASSEAVDRHGEVIKQDGWLLERYKSNPVILWGHDHYKLPIGKSDNVYVDNENRLIVEGTFASKEANPLADNVRMLYNEGMINTVSVGFIPLEMNGNIITKAELLEISLVTVPANPEAVSLMKSKGFDTISGFSFDEFMKSADDEVEVEEEEKEEVVEEKPVEETPVVEEKVEEDDSVEIEDEDDTIEIVDEEEESATLEEAEKDVKAGRTLSEKTRSQIATVIENAKTFVTSLETLLSESDTPKDGSKIVTVKSDELVVKKELLETLQNTFRSTNKKASDALTDINSLLS